MQIFPNIFLLSQERSRQGNVYATAKASIGGEGACILKFRRVFATKYIREAFSRQDSAEESPWHRIKTLLSSKKFQEIFLTIFFFISFQPCMCGSLLIRCRRRGGCYQIQITLFAFPLCFFPSRSSQGVENFFSLVFLFSSLPSSFSPSVRETFSTWPTLQMRPKVGGGRRENFCSDICESRRVIRKVESCKKFDFMHVQSLPLIFWSKFISYRLLNY